MTNPKNPDDGGFEDDRPREGEELADLEPGSDPHDAQEEAKVLRPNEDARTQEERDNPLEAEFEAENERDLEGRESQHRPLTDSEDNEKVNRIEEDRAEAASQGTDGKLYVRGEVAPRNYLVSAGALRGLFIASGILATAAVLIILVLASASPRARYTPADETQYQRTLTQATEALGGLELNGEGAQSARIPIEEAMAMVASQGLEAVSQSLAAAPAETAPAEPDPQDGVAQDAQAAPEAAQEEAQDTAQDMAQEAPAEAEVAEAAPGEEAQASTEAPDETVNEITDETTAASQDAPAQDAPAQAEAVTELTAGQPIYEANCASCHQADGAGIPGAFPPVAGHAAALYNAEGGRTYLINLLLYGLQGEIQVQGQTYNGVMPPWQQLSDENIADILNYVVTAWDGNQQLQGFSPYEAAEVAELRASSLTGNDVYALRQQLGLSGDE